MTDKELLELAAKAVGVVYNFCRPEIGGCQVRTGLVSGWWNPLCNDGDALRLAVKLGISISFSHSTRLDVAYPSINEVSAFAGWSPTYFEATADDWSAATRRAIVRAAAAIGKAMP